MNLKKILALVMVLAMVMALGITAMAEDVPAGTYTITVTNSNSAVSINNRTFSAYKLFDVTYPDAAATTVYGNDSAPHAYTLSTSSVFYTTAAAKEIIEGYFVLTAIEGDATKVVATPIIKDATGKLPTEEGYDSATAASIFTAEKAYEMAQKLNPYLPTTPNATGTGSGETATIDVSNKGDAGYYLVTGAGVTKDESGNATGDDVTAAVALTTTDPKAAIVAKVDGVKVEKEIDEGTTSGAIDDEDVKEDNHAIGDTVPFIIKSKVPNMTGYEKYYFIVNDVLSKGLTFNNDIAIKFVDSNGDEQKTLAANTDYIVTSTGGDGADTRVEVVFRDFIKYKGTLVTDGNFESLGLTQAQVGTYQGTYEDWDIIITYSATVNQYAVIGDIGNKNEATITFSNKPDEVDNGIPGNPDKPSNPQVTGETPSSTTKTYLTGLQIKKVDGQNSPLADATFELTGTNLNTLKETSKEYFRAITTGETATHYLLTDGTYTTTEPVTVDDPSTVDINEITLNSYVKTWNGETPAPGYIVDTVKSFEKTGSGNSVKYTITTDSEGIITLTGLEAGDYVLEETEAPDGYNKLTDKIYINITAGNTEEGDLETHTWTITYKHGQNGTEQTLQSTDATAQLFDLSIVNNSGAELPSTGGIGTTMFYVIGSVLVLAAGILLITKRRASAE